MLAIVGAAGIGLLRHIHRERMGDGEREGMPVSSFAATTALLVGWWLTIEVTRAFGIHVPAGIDRNYGTWFTLTGMWVVLGLLTFSVGLGLRLAALRLWGCVFWALAMATGLCVSIPSSGVEWEPFANFRGLAFILLIICTAALAYVRHHAEDKMGERERTSLPTGGFAVLASVLVTWWLTIEVTRVFGVSMPDGLDRTYGTWFALTGMWVVLGLLTFLAGIPLRLPALRWCGCAFWGLAVATGLCVSAPSFGAEWTPFVSFRGLAFILLIACTAAIGFVRHHTGDKLSDGERSFMATSGFAVVVSVLVTCWLSIEVCRIFDVASPVGTDLALPTWLGLGAMWAVLGITSVGIGMAWRMRPLRYLGFAIGAGAVGTALVAGSLSHNELWIPFINWRMLAAMLGLGGIVLAAWMYLNEDSDATEDERHVLTPTVFAVTGMVLAVWASTVEARSMVHWNGGDSGTDWQLTGWCVVAAVWAVASAAGMALGLRWRLEALRWTASMTWICGAALALAVSMPSAKAAWLPFLNARALAMALVVGTVALIAWMVHRYRDDLSASEQSLANPGYFSVSGALLALFALTLETFHFFRHTQWPSASNWHHAGHVAISVVWSLYAAGWLAAGVSARQATSRWLSLCLFGLALAKLFAYDLRLLKLGSLHRMISFGVLGLILLGVAFLYGRFGAYIRGDAEDDPDEDTDDEA